MVIAERFREAVERCDWSAVDPRLARKTGQRGRRASSACMLGPVHERRPYAHQLANDLLTRADQLMYNRQGAQLAARVPERPGRDGIVCETNSIPRNFPPQDARATLETLRHTVGVAQG